MGLKNTKEKERWDQRNKKRADSQLNVLSPIAYNPFEFLRASLVDSGVTMFSIIFDSCTDCLEGRSGVFKLKLRVLPPNVLYVEPNCD